MCTLNLLRIKKKPFYKTVSGFQKFGTSTIVETVQPKSIK